MTGPVFQNSYSTGNRFWSPSFQVQKMETLWPVIIACKPREKIFGENIEIFSHNRDFVTLLILNGKVFRRIHGNECLFDNCVIVSGNADHVEGANVP